MKNGTSLIVILGAMIVLSWLWSVVKIIAIILFPFVFVAAVIYFIGYWTPQKFHDEFQAKVRGALDWLAFNTNPKVWPAINGARTALDWLGLHVKPGT